MADAPYFSARRGNGRHGRNTPAKGSAQIPASGASLDLAGRTGQMYGLSYANGSCFKIAGRQPPAEEINFEDTKVAFRGVSTADLQIRHALFWITAHPKLSAFMQKAAKWIMNHPRLAKISGAEYLLGRTVFQTFCGGETLPQTSQTIKEIYRRSGLKTILDYAVEGEKTEAGFRETLNQIIATIEAASAAKGLAPYVAVKVSGIVPADLLAKVQQHRQTGQEFPPQLAVQWEDFLSRCEQIIKRGALNEINIFLDAEESWIQGAIDEMALYFMRRYNKQRAVVQTAVQLYRTDRLAYLSDLISTAKQEDFQVGLKLVRGAYMEKERERAKRLGYPDPINPNKETTDCLYNEAITLCIQNIDVVTQFTVASHNEQSALHTLKLMQRAGIAFNDQRIWFAQLMGMSDHISNHLSALGCNVCKYMPWGPLKDCLPYLLRRAEENSSAGRQAPRELRLVRKEIKRRF